MRGETVLTDRSQRLKALGIIFVWLALMIVCGVFQACTTAGKTAYEPDSTLADDTRLVDSLWQTCCSQQCHNQLPPKDMKTPQVWSEFLPQHMQKVYFTESELKDALRYYSAR